MVIINSGTGPTSDQGPDKDADEVLSYHIDSDGFTFERAMDIAKIKAKERSDHAMMLSWFNADTGESFPDYECGSGREPFWIRYARGRGANLTVDFNDGRYVFMILKI